MKENKKIKTQIFRATTSKLGDTKNIKITGPVIPPLISLKSSDSILVSGRRQAGAISKTQKDPGVKLSLINNKDFEYKKSQSTQIEENKLRVIREKKKTEIIEGKISEKKKFFQLQGLIQEQSKLRKALDNTRDQTTQRLVSKKIMNLNLRIKKLMDAIKGRTDNEKLETVQSDEREYASNLVSSERDLNRKFSITLNKMSHKHSSSSRGQKNKLTVSKKALIDADSSISSFSGNSSSDNEEDKKIFHKMVENNAKVDRILIENKLLEQKKKTSLNTIEKFSNEYPNFIFLRPTKKHEKQLYFPSTNIKKGSNLNNRSYRPKGFRQTNKNDKVPNHPYYAELKSSTNRRTIQEIIEDESEDKSSTMSPRGKISRSVFLTSARRQKSPVHKRSHSASLFYIQDSSMHIPDLRHFRHIYNKISNDNKFIQSTIRHKYKRTDRKFKDSDYDNLLKLYELYQNVDPYEMLKKKVVDHDMQSADLIRRLEGKTKYFFNDVVKQVHYEDRILCKQKNYDVTQLEQKLASQKMHKEYRKIAWQTMYMKGEHLKDDNEEIIHQFEHHYSNLDNLHWILRKKNLFRNTKPRILTNYNKPKNKIFK